MASNSEEFDPLLFIEEASHLGWVPCVSGHLDFGLTAVGLSGGFLSNKKDVKHETINFASQGKSQGHARRIALQSWVDWKDVLPGDGEFRVVVAAESKSSQNLDDRYLKGHVCLYPRCYKKEHPEVNSLLMNPFGELAEIRKKYNNLSPLEKSSQWSKTQNDYSNEWDKLNKILTSADVSDNTANEFYFVEFYINHAGLVYLKYKNTYFDEIKSLDSDDIYVLIRQAFYYLKYAIHKHKHHTEEADALTTIVSYEHTKKHESGIKLVGQLKRELTRIKRTQKENHRRHDDSEALGILGYMKSLLRTCLESGLLNKPLFEREFDWTRGMQDSFSAQHERIQTKHNRIDSAGQVARQWTGILLAYTSLTALLWVNINKSSQAVTDDEPGTNSDYIFEIFTGDALGIFLAYLICIVFIWSLNFTIRQIKLMDERPHILRWIYKQPFYILSLLWVFVLSVISYIWYLYAFNS